MFFPKKRSTIGQASMEDDRRHILNCIAGRGLDEEPLADDPSAPDFLADSRDGAEEGDISG